ncbi:MAG: hypothetical protein RLZZ136_1451 [Pseudomonadota bacterium]|jgi:hypothetical protein
MRPDAMRHNSFIAVAAKLAKHAERAVFLARNLCNHMIM